MSPASPAIVEFARRLLAGDSKIPGTANLSVDQPMRACEKLRVPVTRLAGAAGFYSMLSRALSQAKLQSPSLAGIQVSPDGLLTGFNDVDHSFDGAEGAESGEVLLLAELLWLFVTLIGESLTLSLVREAWPDVSTDSVKLSAEVEHE